MGKSGSRLNGKKGLEIEGEAGKRVDDQRLVLLKILEGPVGINQLDLMLVGIDPDLDYPALLVILSLSLNLTQGVAWGQDFKRHVGREVRFCGWNSPSSKALLANQRGIGKPPVTRRHREDAVGRKPHPSHVQAAVIDQVLDQSREDGFMSKVNRRHEYNLPIHPLPPLPLFTGGKEFFPSDSRFCCHNQLNRKRLPRSREKSGSLSITSAWSS